MRRIIPSALLFFVVTGCSGGSSPSSATLPSADPPGPPAAATEAQCAQRPASDWVTFAHDQLRSGCTTENTSISKANVAQLQKAWSFSQPQQVVASPIVVGKTLYFATSGSGTVYAINASSGVALWSRVLGDSTQEIRQTPLYDNGLLLVGTHNFGAPVNGVYPPEPSTFYALNATNGNTVWSANVQGTIRGSPIVANGVVYVPVAGGDLPWCLQGGISAFNERTGQPLWRFNVDPTPSDGGSVWGAVAFDGSRLYFGTGNTCATSPLTANAIVSINPSGGSLIWQLNTAPQIPDLDVGSGVLLANDMAIALGKNGILYFVDASSGAVLHEVNLQTAYAQGGFSTPVTDGTTIVVGTAAQASTTSTTRSRTDEEPAFFGRIRAASSSGGRLMAFDFNSSQKWSITTQNPVHSTAAISNGVVFAATDTQLRAIDLNSGQTLWQYDTGVQLDASPAIDASGVYIIDTNGTLYKFALP